MLNDRSSTPIDFIDLGSAYGPSVHSAHDYLQSPGAPPGVRIGSVIGVDKSQQMLQRFRARAEALSIPVETYLYDFDDGRGLPPPDACAHVVIVSFLLSHVRSVASVLRLAERVARHNSVVLVVDADYSQAEAFDDEALIRTVELIQQLLRHPGFDDLDELAAGAGLYRAEGLFDGVEHFQPGARSPKHDALSFCANFEPDSEARVAWERIRGGRLVMRQIRRVYVKP